MAAEPGLRGSFWPSRIQTELLRAGLFEAPEAIESWRTVPRDAQTPLPNQIIEYLPVAPSHPIMSSRSKCERKLTPPPGYNTRSFMMSCKPVEWVYGPDATSGDRVPVAR